MGGHFPPPVVIPMVSAHGCLPFPVVDPDSPLVLAVLVSYFPILVLVCVQISLPPALLECGDWIDN